MASAARLTHPRVLPAVGPHLCSCVQSRCLTRQQLPGKRPLILILRTPRERNRLKDRQLKAPTFEPSTSLPSSVFSLPYCPGAARTERMPPSNRRRPRGARKMPLAQLKMRSVQTCCVTLAYENQPVKKMLMPEWKETARCPALPRCCDVWSKPNQRTKRQWSM